MSGQGLQCLQEIHGKDEFLHALQIQAPRFQLFGTLIPNNAIAGGSAMCIHKDLVPADDIVTHLITCQGRDRIVNIRSGRRSLVIVYVHFEPELTLRSLRERLRLITPHWPHYPDAIGTFMGGLQYLRARGREIQCLESDIHRR